jgi:hypothetical protein
MGAIKYIEGKEANFFEVFGASSTPKLSALSEFTTLTCFAELHKKKQSDVLRFLLRVRCWEVR